MVGEHWDILKEIPLYLTYTGKRPAIKYMVETCLYTSWTSKYMKHGYQRSMV